MVVDASMMLASGMALFHTVHLYEASSSSFLGTRVSTAELAWVREVPGM